MSKASRMKWKFFEENEYHKVTAKMIKEDEELLEAGFDYVTERGRIKINRKRK
jgi:hypothetical protein